VRVRREVEGEMGERERERNEGLRKEGACLIKTKITSWRAGLLAAFVLGRRWLTLVDEGRTGKHVPW
jgi:hypothetical protein